MVFRYRPEGRAILRGLDLTIHQGERILLEGASGGGKSTLAALLTGLRTPESGLLLLNGLDRPTLGSSWHQLATEAPQFHENHILAGSLAFNLLMGRNWPASREDLTKARALCVELGLGALLDRMPAGLMQQVGETGWQLSHGERSRVFLARALLQDARLTILDESFAALDPETLKACLKSAVAHARTLVVSRTSIRDRLSAHGLDPRKAAVGPVVSDNSQPPPRALTRPTVAWKRAAWTSNAWRRSRNSFRSASSSSSWLAKPVLVVRRHQRLGAKRRIGGALQDRVLFGQQAQGGKLVLDLLDRDQDLLAIGRGGGVEVRVRLGHAREIAAAVEYRQREQGPEPRSRRRRGEQRAQGG